MIQQAHADQRQSLGNLFRRRPGVAGGQRQAAGMVVGQDDGGGVCRDGLFHHLFDRDGGGVHRALKQLGTAQHPAPVVQQQQVDLLVAAAQKSGHQISARLGAGGDGLAPVGAVGGVIAGTGGHQLEQAGGERAHPLHAAKGVVGGVQHPGKAAEALQQAMGDLIGVAPLMGEKQQQLQRVYRRKAGEALL